MTAEEHFNKMHPQEDYSNTWIEEFENWKAEMIRFANAYHQAQCALPPVVVSEAELPADEKEAFIAGYRYFRSICEGMKKYPFDGMARLEAINQYEKWKTGN